MQRTRSAMRVTPSLISSLQQARFVVVDTNAWIDALDSVMSLRRRLTVVVPSAVVQELDGLKQKQDALGTRARTAIKAIYDATATGESWMRGQRYDEHLGSSMRIANRDDEILSCALYFNTYVAPTALITGDYGLATKCNINHVATADMAGLLNSLDTTTTQPSPPPTIAVLPSKKCRQEVEIPGFSYSTSVAAAAPAPASPPETTLLSLPIEIQSKVLSLLPPRALMRVEEVSSGLRYLLSPRNKRSRAIWEASLKRSHGRATGSYGHKHPKHWYHMWRRSVTTPSR